MEQCPHCGLTVLFLSTDKCPNCQKPSDLTQRTKVIKDPSTLPRSSRRRVRLGLASTNPPWVTPTRWVHRAVVLFLLAGSALFAVQQLTAGKLTFQELLSLPILIIAGLLTHFAYTTELRFFRWSAVVIYGFPAVAMLLGAVVGAIFKGDPAVLWVGAAALIPASCSIAIFFGPPFDVPNDDAA